MLTLISQGILEMIQKIQTKRNNIFCSKFFFQLRLVNSLPPHIKQVSEAASKFNVTFQILSCHVTLAFHTGHKHICLLLSI